MADELNIGDGQEQEIEIEITSDYEYLNGAINALDALSEVDTAMVPDRQQRGIRRARKQAIDIIIYLIDNWHNELFDNGEDQGKD